MDDAVDHRQALFLLSNADEEGAYLGIGAQRLGLVTLTAVEVRQLQSPVHGLLVVFLHSAGVEQHLEDFLLDLSVGLNRIVKHQPFADENGGVVFHILDSP